MGCPTPNRVATTKGETTITNARPAGDPPPVLIGEHMHAPNLQEDRIMKIMLRKYRITYLGALALVASLALNANAQIRAYSVTDRQVDTLLTNIERTTDDFKNEIGHSLDRSVINGTAREDNINAMVASFETATDRLRINFSSRRSTGADVESVLSQAVSINRFMLRNQVSPQAQRLWSQIRGDLDTLAGVLVGARLGGDA